MYVFIIKFLDEVATLTENDIVGSEIEKITSSWVTDFLNYFNYFFDDTLGEQHLPRFLELRPNSFHI
jgi:hypothetical protein